MPTSQASGPSRRAILAAAAAPPLLGPGRLPASLTADADAILATYDSFGDKASGGAADEASGAWLLKMLDEAGYRAERQPIEVPAYLGPPPTLTCGTERAELVAQAIVEPTGADGLTAPLRPAGSGVGGAISLLVLPYARWSTALGEVERRVRAELAAGAQAVVLVTTGPTGEAVALNTPVDHPLFRAPVAILAPKSAEPFLAAAATGATATLHMAGRSVRRPAFNVVARLDRKAPRWLVLSTPRSGWFRCAGERGSGLAVWLLLARWAARATSGVNLALVATSGHEYEYAGGERYLRTLAPPPAETALWTHLGANVATRDWHERGTRLSPLPSADPQRFLLVSEAWLPAARAAFRGQPGLEHAYPADPRAAAGELGSVLAAGYPAVAGVFGAHRFHHTRADDLRTVSGALVAPVVAGFARLIADVVGPASLDLP